MKCDGISEVLSWDSMDIPLVQILVIVANIQLEILYADVEKVFMWTVIEHELVVLKTKG